MRVAVGIDDSDGTERSASRALTANKWTYVEWKLSDSAQWYAWTGNSNGAITASTVKLDAIWLYHANTRRSEEHTSELQSLMRRSYAVFCLKKKKTKHNQQ